MLLDSSGLFCLHDPKDPHHGTAGGLVGVAPVCLTHSYVLAEFVALAHARRLPRASALHFAARVQDNPAVEVVYVEEGLHRDALVFLQQRLDKDWSLCDAVSFLLMRIRGLTEALTTDHHFEQAGFIRLLKP